jgi:prevent-host-death family protein
VTTFKEHVMEVSVRELKTHLSEYLRRVAAGEEVAITSRGRLVARLAPVAAQKDGAENAAIARIRALPFVIPGKGGKPEGAQLPIRIKRGQKTLAELVAEDRK